MKLKITAKRPPKKWIRTLVATVIFDKINYVKERFGMYNLPEAWRYVITFLLLNYDQEELCQDMARSANIILEPLPAAEPNAAESQADNG